MEKVKYTTYDELPLMLSAPEVAAVLGISRAGAYELVRAEGFPALRIGSRIVVMPTSGWSSGLWPMAIFFSRIFLDRCADGRRLMPAIQAGHCAKCFVYAAVFLRHAFRLFWIF